MKRVLIGALLIGAIVGLNAFPNRHGGSAPGLYTGRCCGGRPVRPLSVRQNRHYYGTCPWRPVIERR